MLSNCTQGVSLPEVINSEILGSDELKRDVTFESTERLIIEAQGASLSQAKVGTSFYFQQPASSCGVIDLDNSRILSEISPYILMSNNQKIVPVSGWICTNDFPALFEKAVLSLGTTADVTGLAGARDDFFVSEVVKRTVEASGHTTGTAIVGDRVQAIEVAETVNSTLSPLDCLTSTNANTTKITFKKIVTMDCDEPFEVCVGSDTSAAPERTQNDLGQWFQYPAQFESPPPIAQYDVNVSPDYLYRCLVASKASEKGRSKKDALADQYVLKVAQKLPISLSGMIPTSSTFKLSVNLGRQDLFLRGDAAYSLLNSLALPLTSAAGYPSGGSAIKIGFDILSLRLDLCIRRLTPKASEIMHQARILRHSYQKYDTQSFPLPQNGQLLVQIPSTRRAKAMVVSVTPRYFFGDPSLYPAVTTPNVRTDAADEYEMTNVKRGSMVSGGLGGVDLLTFQITDPCGKRFPASDRDYSDFTESGLSTNGGALVAYGEFKKLLRHKDSFSFLQWRNHLKFYCANFVQDAALDKVGFGESQSGMYQLKLQVSQDPDKAHPSKAFSFTDYDVHVCTIADTYLDFILQEDGSSTTKAY